jgi:hypothetical protein
MAPFLVAVHAGAGYHSCDKEDAYKLGKRSCAVSGVVLSAITPSSNRTYAMLRLAN